MKTQAPLTRSRTRSTDLHSALSFNAALYPKSTPRRTMNLAPLFAALLTLPAALLAQMPAPPSAGGKAVPPPGVTISDADRRELEAGAAALKIEVDALAKDGKVSPQLRGLLPDVEVWWKAVDYALRYNEIYDVKQVGAARSFLAEGTARAKALRSGQAPWTSATGPVVRGFRSRIDGSAQPYGVLVPGGWKPGAAGQKRAVWVFNHGRGETMTELAFMGGQMKGSKEFTPADAIVVHPYGRFCNATKFAGETDVFEALGHASAAYGGDPGRVVMTGFSMGGASVWHLAAHHAWRWVAASPGAGFAESATYLKIFGEGKEPPPWWEQSLWHLTNATDAAANLANTHLVAYSGEIDPQRASADLMEKATAAEGVKMERVIGPKTGHKYEPGAKKELDAKLAEYAAKGRDEVPAQVRLVCYSLKYNQQAWVIADALERHWERAEISAEIADEGTIRATTKNVAALTFDMQASAVPLDKTHAPRVVLDGQELVGPPVKAPWVAHFAKADGKWAAVAKVWDITDRPIAARTNGAAAPGYRKQHNLQGPIDDAFMESFVFVRPTGKPLNATVGAWVKSEIDRAVPQWRTVFRGDARVVDDTAVTPEMVANSNLVLWGDPSSNKVLAGILGRLPIKWDATTLALGKLSVPAASHAPVLIFPNPLNPRRYVVLNSSFTFRQGSNASNATQTAKLPDWAIIDLRTPPSDKAPGGVVDAGFYGENWEVAR